MGYVLTGHDKIGSKITIKQDAVEISATITGKPFYKQGTVRK
jgi:hypothetical protein